jgi:hypothetical protein
MAQSISAFRIAPPPSAVPAWFFNASFVLLWVNLVFFPAAYFSGIWIYDPGGMVIPTDFVNVWAAGKLVLEGHAALAYDWDVQKQVELALIKQSFSGYIAWHYPPPFLFVAMLLAQLPYSAAFAIWVSVSLLPYLAAMRAIVGRAYGLMLAAAFPIVVCNGMVGQNGFVTAALIGGTLYLLPRRPALSGICLGLLTYKPQYGFLFPIVLIASAEWTVFFSAMITAVVLVFASWLAFGIGSWEAFFHWLPTFSKAFLSEGKATWWRLQSLYALVRHLGGTEQLAWMLQWTMTAAVAATLVTVWRSNVRYSLKAAALATGTLLTTPYLFMYDMMVLAIPIAWLTRLWLSHGFRSYERPALAVALGVILSFAFLDQPVGPGATLIVGALVLRRAGPWWRGAIATSIGELTRPGRNLSLKI